MTFFTKAFCTRSTPSASSTPARIFSSSLRLLHPIVTSTPQSISVRSSPNVQPRAFEAMVFWHSLLLLAVEMKTLKVALSYRTVKIAASAAQVFVQACAAVTKTASVGSWRTYI